jgi:hypothetical protein
MTFNETRTSPSKGLPDFDTNSSQHSIAIPGSAAIEARETGNARPSSEGLVFATSTGASLAEFFDSLFDPGRDA